MSSNQVAYSQQRRSSRIEKAIPLAVQGVDVSRAPFLEEVTTLAISCHGCSYQMKREVLPGAIVVLDMGQHAKGNSEWPARARVKYIKKLNTAADPAYGIAVEFESAGNIWGIASPPEDWFPGRGSKTPDPLNPLNLGRELRVVARNEAQGVPARNASAAAVPFFKKGEAAASLSPWFTELMAGISSQIQTTVNEIAAVTLANEKSRLLEEFRAQLRKEASETIERVVENSKEDLAQRALKILTEATESDIQARHERLVGEIEQDMENAKQRMLVQGNELNQRIDGMATRTIEQLQRNIETSRNEATTRFVTRLREQVAPVLEEARADHQKLVASQAAFKEESQAIYTRVTSELQSSVSAKLSETCDELDKKSSAALAESAEKLQELSQSCGNVARDSIQTLIASAADRAQKNLEERAAEISSSFTGELEARIRDYLQFIGESIAEFPKKTPVA